MDRRNFLKSMLAAGVAPYVITTAGVLMPIRQIVAAPILTSPGIECAEDEIITHEGNGWISVWGVQKFDGERL